MTLNQGGTEPPLLTGSLKDGDVCCFFRLRGHPLQPQDHAIPPFQKAKQNLGVT